MASSFLEKVSDNSDTSSIWTTYRACKSLAIYDIVRPKKKYKYTNHGTDVLHVVSVYGDGCGETEENIGYVNVGH